MGLIAVVANGVGIADEIEPPGSQPFSMPGRGEQPVNQLLIPVGRVGSQVGIDFCRCWRQARQVKRNPSQQRDWIGLRCGRKVLLLQCCQDERINPVAAPSLFSHHR